MPGGIAKGRISHRMPCIAVFILLSAFSLHRLPAQDTLSLSGAIEAGLRNNFSVRLQMNDALIAAQDNTLGNAGFLPSVTLGASQNNTFSNTHQETSAGTVKDISDATASTLNAGIQVDWTLFDGCKMFVEKKMLSILEDLGENGTRIVIEGTVADIMMTYYGMIQLQQMVGVLRDAVDLSVQRKNIAVAKLLVGSGSRMMLLQSSVDLNADSTRLIQQETRLAQTMVDLNRLIGFEAEHIMVLSDSLRLKDPVPMDTLLERALSCNAQLLRARLDQDLFRQGVRQEQAGRYPQIDLGAEYTFSQLRSQTGYLQYNRSFGLTAGLTISYTLFNGFNINRAIRNAKVMVSSGELSYQDTEQEIRAGLRRNYLEYLADLEIIRMQEANIRVARQNVEVAFEKYQLGSINDVELREIQNKLIDSQYQLILSTFEAKKAETELVRLSGSLLKSF